MRGAKVLKAQKNKEALPEWAALRGVYIFRLELGAFLPGRQIEFLFWSEFV
jgi:hypothetical protein